MQGKLIAGAITIGVVSTPLAAWALASYADFGAGVGVPSAGDGQGVATSGTDDLIQPVIPPAPPSPLQQQIAQSIAREYISEHSQNGGLGVLVTSVGPDVLPPPAATLLWAPTRPSADH